jgi:hypothetical protein
MTTSEIAGLLNATSIGLNRWTAACSAHNDKEQSLYITEGRDKRTLLRCSKGCGVEAIVAGLGLELADLFVIPPAPGYVAILRARLASTDARRLRQMAQLGKATGAIGRVDAALRQITDHVKDKDDTFMRLLNEAMIQASAARRFVGVVSDHI